MPVFIDQTGRSLMISSPPQRIISLVPSQTELLYDLGLEKEVVGITKFCIHPDQWFRNKTRVGGTRQLKMELIHQLQPDLIIANKEENVKEQIEELEKHFPVWISDVNNLPGAYEMITQIGSIVSKEKAAQEINSRIKDNFAELQTGNYQPQTVYLIWQDPFMTVGGDTFIHSMLDAAGFFNLYGNKKRYPEITIEDLRSASPALLFLSSEPFPFKEKQAKELQELLPETRVILVDGELFSWYGSRLMRAPAYFSRLWAAVTG
jgi:ABC-type Fe3+-hydroxamate transport system substrate-binding protein